MATVSFTIATSDLTTMVDALSVRWGYQPILPDGTRNPDTPGEFVRLHIAQWIIGETREHRLNTARAAVSVEDVSVT